MLPKAHRLQLRGNSNFFASSQKKHSQALSLFWKSTLNTIPKAAVITKKSALNSASARNLVKRRLLEILYSFIKKGIRGGEYVVVFRNAKEFSYKDLQKNVEKLFSEFIN